MNDKNPIIIKTDLSSWLILGLAVLISVILFWQKATFLYSLLPDQTYSSQYFFLLAINGATYIAMICWVHLLLKGPSNLWIKIFVIVVGIVFSLLTRLVESGEEITRQGVDFTLAKHFFLALLGHGEIEETVLAFCFQWALFIILLLGLLWRFSLNRSSLVFPKYLLGLFLFGLALSFVSPSPVHIPKSLGQNGLVYLVKTAWFPVPDIRLSDRSAVREWPSNSFQEEAAPKLNALAEEEKDALNNKQVGKAHATKSLFGVAKGMNVAIIALESTSANALSFYPNSNGIKGNTPFMHKMSKHSLLVNEMSSVMASTTKSIVSILCGIEPYLGTNTFEVTLGIPVDCFADRLSDIGYNTAFFQSATKYYEGRDRLIKNIGIKDFFSIDSLAKEELVDKQAVGSLGYEDDVLLKPHKKWLESQVSTENKSKPFLAFYMTLAQHHPYLPAPKKQNNADRVDDIHSKNQHAFSNKYLQDYMYSLSYIDSYVEKIVEQYKAQGLYENTIFVFVGDHGESFGRYHRPRFHNNVLYREGVWVPFFVANEKLFNEQQRIDGQFSLIDVAPSLEYLLGMTKSSQYRGKNALVPQGKNTKVFSSCWYHTRCLSVSDENYKYIFNFDDSPDELFRRGDDFRELNNIAKQNPELIADYKDQVIAWYDEALRFYETYYQSVDPDYLSKPESFYQFPTEIIPNRSEIKRW